MAEKIIRADPIPMLEGIPESRADEVREESSRVEGETQRKKGIVKTDLLIKAIQDLTIRLKSSFEKKKETILPSPARPAPSDGGGGDMPGTPAPQNKTILQSIMGGSKNALNQKKDLLKEAFSVRGMVGLAASKVNPGGLMGGILGSVSEDLQQKEKAKIAQAAYRENYTKNTASGRDYTTGIRAQKTNESLEKFKEENPEASEEETQLFKTNLSQDKKFNKSVNKTIDLRAQRKFLVQSGRAGQKDEFRGLLNSARASVGADARLTDAQQAKLDRISRKKPQTTPYGDRLTGVDEQPMLLPAPEADSGLGPTRTRILDQAMGDYSADNPSATDEQLAGFKEGAIEELMSLGKDQVEELKKILAAAVLTNEALLGQKATLDEIGENIEKTIPSEEDILEGNIAGREGSGAPSLLPNDPPAPEEKTSILDTIMNLIPGAKGLLGGLGKGALGAAKAGAGTLGGLLGKIPGALGGAGGVAKVLGKVALPVTAALSAGSGVMDEAGGKKIESAADIIPEGWNKINPFAYAMNAGRYGGNKINKGIEAMSGGESLGSLIYDAIHKDPNAAPAGTAATTAAKVPGVQPSAVAPVGAAAVVATAASALNSADKVDPAKIMGFNQAAKDSIKTDSIAMEDSKINPIAAAPTIVNAPSTVNNNPTIIKQRKQVRNVEPTYLSILTRNLI